MEKYKKYLLSPALQGLLLQILIKTQTVVLKF